MKAPLEEMEVIVGEMVSCTSVEQFSKLDVRYRDVFKSVQENHAWKDYEKLMVARNLILGSFSPLRNPGNYLSLAQTLAKDLLKSNPA